MSNNAYLKVRSAVKVFPGVRALDNVSIDAYQGEALGLIGVNGAGKSTLMNALAGEIKVDGGKFIIDGNEISIQGHKDAEQNGISLIHQEPVVFSALTVGENVLVNQLSKFTRGGLINYKKVYEYSKKYLDMVGAGLDPSLKVENVTVGGRQLIEVARALSQNSKIILFDEPTSSLSAKEKDKLFEIIRSLKKENKVIIYITHFLDEIMEICERATIMMSGKVTGNRKTTDTSMNEYIRLMVGENVELVSNKRDTNTSDNEVVLKVEDLNFAPMISNVSFEARRGEILGFWGLLGSGRTEIFRALLGLDKPVKGKISVTNRKGKLERVDGKALLRKVGYVSENRHVDGLFMPMPIWKNITMANLDKYRRPLLDEDREHKDTEDMIKYLRIKTPNDKVLVEKLSGGNQQKVILARGVSKDPDIFFMDEPTRGVDVGAKSEIHKLIINIAEQGKTVIVISSEIEEILNLCDRVIIVRDGQATAEVFKKDMEKRNLMRLCIGEEVDAI